VSVLDPTSDSATVQGVVAPRPEPARAHLTARRWLALAPVADALVLTLAVVVERLGGRYVGADSLSAAWMVGFPAIVITLLASRGFYRERLRLQLLDELGTIAGATAIASMITITLPVIAGANTASLPAQGVRLWLFATVYLAASRASIVSSIVASRMSGVAPTPTLIVGAGSVGRVLAKRLIEHREIGLKPIGFLDKDPLEAVDVTQNGASLPVLGASWDLGDVIDAHGVEHVLFTFSTAPHEVMLRMIEECAQRDVRVTIVPRLFERMPHDTTIDFLGGIPLVSLHQSSPRSVGIQVKYAVDRLVALTILLVTLPVLAVIALAVRLKLGRPIFFRQVRVGRDGRTFEMLKFRTMHLMDWQADVTDNAVRVDVAPGGVEGDDRRTPLGMLLRRTSLDELPQLINVLRGDMSLVGPRPERPQYVDVFRDQVYRYDDRHRVKSGITGWAQINGLRGKTSLDDRVEWDNWYIENWSGWLDLKILLRTALAVFRNARIVE
jgi:exopolysaccharide biosynthesis polyprenyl glycosylphosphotransferase